jgi:hypothetical protein
VSRVDGLRLTGLGLRLAAAAVTTLLTLVVGRAHTLRGGPATHGR